MVGRFLPGRQKAQTLDHWRLSGDYSVMTKTSWQEAPSVESAEDFERWAVITGQLRPILGQAVQEDGNVVASLLALTTCAADLLSASATTAEDLEQRLGHFIETATAMSRGKYLLLKKGSAQSVQ